MRDKARRLKNIGDADVAIKLPNQDVVLSVEKLFGDLETALLSQKIGRFLISESETFTPVVNFQFINGTRLPYLSEALRLEQLVDHIHAELLVKAPQAIAVLNAAISLIEDHIHRTDDLFQPSTLGHPQLTLVVSTLEEQTNNTKHTQLTPVSRVRSFKEILVQLKATLKKFEALHDSSFKYFSS